MSIKSSHAEPESKASSLLKPIERRSVSPKRTDEAPENKPIARSLLNSPPKYSRLETDQEEPKSEFAADSFTESKSSIRPKLPSLLKSPPHGAQSHVKMPAACRPLRSNTLPSDTVESPDKRKAASNSVAQAAKKPRVSEPPSQLVQASILDKPAIPSPSEAAQHFRDLHTAATRRYPDFTLVIQQRLDAYLQDKTGKPTEPLLLHILARMYQGKRTYFTTDTMTSMESFCTHDIDLSLSTPYLVLRAGTPFLPCSLGALFDYFDKATEASDALGEAGYSKFCKRRLRKEMSAIFKFAPHDVFMEIIVDRNLPLRKAIKAAQKGSWKADQPPLSRIRGSPQGLSPQTRSCWA